MQAWRRSSWRTQRVADGAGERAGRRHGVVQIGKSPAALVPRIAAHRPHVLHAAVDEGARGKRFGAGIAVIPGGIPVYRDGVTLIGGIGVSGVDPNAAEFAVVAATAGTPFFVRRPLPFPGAVFIDGFRLPFVNQTTRPSGTAPARAPGGEYLAGPLAGSTAPDAVPPPVDTVTARRVREPSVPQVV